jgi:hypothetical protein
VTAGLPHVVVPRAACTPTITRARRRFKDFKDLKDFKDPARAPSTHMEYLTAGWSP